MKQIIKAFLGDVPFTANKFGSGHINSTYQITTPQGLFVLQRINHQVFKNPVQVMDNIVSVTGFLAKKHCNAMTFLPCKEGNYCYQDQQGCYWRMSKFLSGVALDGPETPYDLYQAGYAFGSFMQNLADFPAPTLHETIKDFHNTVDRYKKFRESLNKDLFDRAKDAADLIGFLDKKEALSGTLQKMREQGQLPLRVTHNDTKLNNVLLDETTRKPLCVLDLDTVMPGLSAYDFGDGIRFGAATDKEDAHHNEMDLQLFEMYTKGYLEAAQDLTEAEIQVLPLSAFIMTLECGMRFLTDYLDGDQYFGISYPEQNLHRARNQLALAADIERNFSAMEAIIAKIRTH